MAWKLNLSGLGAINMYWWDWQEAEPEVWRLIIWRVHDEQSTALLQAYLNRRMFGDASMFEGTKRLFRLKSAKMDSISVSGPAGPRGPEEDMLIFKYMQYLKG